MQMIGWVQLTSFHVPILIAPIGTVPGTSMTSAIAFSSSQCTCVQVNFRRQRSVLYVRATYYNRHQGCRPYHAFLTLSGENHVPCLSWSVISYNLRVQKTSSNIWFLWLVQINLHTLLVLTGLLLHLRGGSLGRNRGPDTGRSCSE